MQEYLRLADDFLYAGEPVVARVERLVIAYGWLKRAGMRRDGVGIKKTIFFDYIRYPLITEA